MNKNPYRNTAFHGLTDKKAAEAWDEGRAIGQGEAEAVLWLALVALRDLSEHPAFADTAPEFNKGGCGYEAAQAIKTYPAIQVALNQTKQLK